MVSRRQRLGVGAIPPRRVAAAACVGMALRGPDLVEADLVGGQVEVGAGVGGIGTVAVADAFDPKLGTQIPLRHILTRRGIGVVDHQAEFVAPAA